MGRLQHPNEKAEAFNSFFGNVFTQDNGYCPDVTKRVAANRLSSVSFTPNKVRDVLCKLKLTTSAGSDSIPNIMLKKCANHLSFLPTLVLIAQAVFVLER